MIKFIFLLTVAWHARTAYAACGDQQVFPELNFHPSPTNLQFPCESTKRIYLTTKRYIPKNFILTRAQIHQNVVYACAPRLRHGVPFTVAKMTLKKGNCVPPVEPYPCWSIQEEGNCQAIQSCTDLVHDAQNILWVLDSGDTNTLDQPIHRCDAKVVGICTKTHKVVSSVSLGDLVNQKSRLQHLVVEYDDTGNAFIYVADGGNNCLIVYDVTRDKGYKIVLPPALHNGCASRDVLYITLIRKTNGLSYLYMNYLCGTNLFSIKTKHLRQGEGSSAVVDHGTIPGDKKLVQLGNDNANYLFVRGKDERNIYLYNTETCLKSSNFVLVQKGGECRLPTHVFPGYQNYMWVISSNTHHYVADKVGSTGADIAIHPLVKDCD